MDQEPVRIPKSSPRKATLAFAKLLKRVDPEATCGFGFEGTALRPGGMLAWSDLWPTPAYPPIPVLLECAGVLNPKTGHRRHHQGDLYLIWRLDLGRREWIEMARSVGMSWTWALDLREVAVRLITEQRKPVHREIGADTVVGLLDRYLNRLSPDDQLHAMAALHDRLFTRMTA